MKLRQKISGGFRSTDGAKDFGVIRSFLWTAKKQGWDILQTTEHRPRAPNRRTPPCMTAPAIDPGARDKFQLWRPVWLLLRRSMDRWKESDFSLPRGLTAEWRGCTRSHLRRRRLLVQSL